MNLRVAQDQKYQEGDSWEWSVWMEGSDDNLDHIREVTYKLDDPSFPKPLRTSDDRGKKFKLEAESLGDFPIRVTFPIHVKVLLKNGEVLKLKHDLELSYPPILIPTPSLGMNKIASMAVSPDGSKVYLGRRTSYERTRLNLGVLSLNSAGTPVGKPRLYPDSNQGIRFDHTSTVTRILVGPKNARGAGKLYLAVNQEQHPHELPVKLTVYDLDPKGEPLNEPGNGPGNYPFPLKDDQVDTIEALALHPKLPRLYMVGHGPNAVYTYALDINGKPRPDTFHKTELGNPPHNVSPNFNGIFDIAVSADGKRLYLGAQDLLEIVDLDPSGQPMKASLRWFAMMDQISGPKGTKKFPNGPRGIFYLHYTERALFRRHPLTPPEAGVWYIPDPWPLYYWPLDNNGDPTQGTAFDHWSGRGEAVERLGGRLWIAADDVFADAYTSAKLVDGVTAVAVNLHPGTNLPMTLASEGPTSYLQNGVLVEVADNGQVIVLTEPIPGSGFIGDEVSDYRLRVEFFEKMPTSKLDVTPAQPQARVDVKLGWVDEKGGTHTASFKQKDKTLPLDFETLPLDLTLRGRAGQIMLSLSVSGFLLDKLKVKLTVIEGSTEGSPFVTEEGISGQLLQFFVRGCGFAPPGAPVLELMSDHAKQYLTAAQRVAVIREDRPKKFIVSCFSMAGGQAHLGQLRTQTEALALLGFNTANLYSWDGIPLKDGHDSINGVLNFFGVTRRSQAVYSPPSYFDFYLKAHQDELTTWAKEQAKYTPSNNGGSTADVVEFAMADEPAWSFPSSIAPLGSDSAFLARYHDYLTAKLTDTSVTLPSDLLHTMVSMGSGAVNAADQPLEPRRLFYWTMRFFQESASHGLALARSALENAFQSVGESPLHAFVNWNNPMSSWWGIDPNRSTPASPARFGYFDWFTSGRLNAHTLWTADWFSDQSAQAWSVSGDLLRSAQMLGSPLYSQEFGGYVVGQSLGEHPSGASYKILSLIGHGAKIIDLYTFGPYALFSNGWSENIAAYPAIAQAMRLVGRTERVLHPGRPERGKIAILLPLASRLWDGDPACSWKFYQQEAKALHYALIHSGYTVDFVDDTDLEQGELISRGYTTLYITGPNVSAKAQAKVENWVGNGGTLVVTAGAAVADEYDQRTDTIDSVLGLVPLSRRADRTAFDTWILTGVMAIDPQFCDGISDPKFGANAMQILHANPPEPLQPLPGPKGAKAVATLYGPPPNDADINDVGHLKKLGAGITINEFEEGMAIAYGFYPGVQYGLSPDTTDPQRLPLRWGKAQRNLAIRPVQIERTIPGQPKKIRTPRPVVLNHEVVEACKLQSESGIAIVLLNWTDEPIDSLDVTVPDVGHFQRVSSAQDGPLKSTASTISVSGRPAVTTVTVKNMRLKDVDVLLFE